MKASFLLLFLILKVGIGDVLERYLIENSKLTYKLFWIHSTATNGSFAFSPISTQNVLALAAIGADEETAKEIIKAANLPNGLSAITEMYSHLQKNLSSTSSLSIHNVISSNINELNNSYVYLTKTAFNAVITHDIDTIDQSTIGVNLLLFSFGLGITSHLNLNTSWIHKFLPYGSLVRFTDMNRRQYNMEMVHTRTPAILREDKEGKAYFIEFPFVDDNLSLTLVCPKKRQYFLKLKESLPGLLSNQTRREVLLEIVLPELVMSYSSTSMLRPLGLNLALSEKANFSGITDFDQYIRDSIEDTYFNITRIPVVEGSRNDNLPIVNLTITHPFIYFLRHNVLGFLMVGRFVKPEGMGIIQY